MQYYAPILASTYGSGIYGNNTYNGSSSGTASTGSSGGVLTNTGFDIALIVTIACVLAFLALLVRFWRKPAKKA